MLSNNVAPWNIALTQVANNPIPKWVIYEEELTKKCTQCHRELLLKEFNKTGKNRLKSACKSCCSEYVKNRRKLRKQQLSQSIT